jgi:hypothetical protein
MATCSCCGGSEVIMEIKDISEFLGEYVITETGLVISVKKDLVMRSRIDKYGYEIITLHKNGKAFTRKVHRLVAIAFIDNPENKPIVNHLDGNKLNNNYRNLEWTTVSENSKHAMTLDLLPKGTNHSNSKLDEQSAGEIKFLIEKGFGNSEIANAFGVTSGCVYSIREGITWKDVEVIRTDTRPITKSAKKLTDQDVKKVKKLLDDGHTCANIGRLFEVSRSAISSIKCGKNWKNV